MYKLQISSTLQLVITRGGKSVRNCKVTLQEAPYLQGRKTKKREKEGKKKEEERTRKRGKEQRKEIKRRKQEGNGKNQPTR